MRAKLIRSGREWPLPIIIKNSFKEFDSWELGKHDYLMVGDVLLLPDTCPAVLAVQIQLPAQGAWSDRIYPWSVWGVIGVRKPCPDCGTEAVHAVVVPVVDPENPTIQRRCNNCGSIWHQSTRAAEARAA